MTEPKELKVARLNARKARKQRDATKTNEDFDLWHRVMLEQERILKELLLKTECDIHHTALEYKCDGHHIQNP